MMSVALNQKHIKLLNGSRDSFRLLKKFSACKLTPSIIKQYHNLLLFHSAFPLNSQVHALAENELDRIISVVKEIQRNKINSLSGIGISGTELTCNFSRPIAQWLVNNFADHVELNDAAASAETVREVFQILLPVVEYEKVTQQELRLKSRIKFLTGITDARIQLIWLLQQFAVSPLSPAVKDELYLQLKVFIRWKLNDGAFRKTFMKIPVKEIFFQKKFIRHPDAAKIMRQKIKNPVKLSEKSRENLLNVMKASLAIHCRETDPITYADENETELFDLDYGIRIALVGMTKDKRLSLESYIGYMAFKNGVPVAYGGGWIWGERCKIGVNIYPPFRGAESAFLFSQVMRLYRWHFGVKKFVVKPYQFGKGNKEGLSSGAFWFYYKLGFRPVDYKTKMLAADKWKNISLNGRHKVPNEQMKLLLNCNVELDLAKKIIPGYDAAVVSAAITQMVNRDFRFSRQDAVNILRRRFNNILLPKKQNGRLTARPDWILVSGLIKDLAGWNKQEKKKFVQLLSLRQNGTERNYINCLQKNKRLWNSLTF